MKAYKKIMITTLVMILLTTALFSTSHGREVLYEEASTKRLELEVLPGIIIDEGEAFQVIVTSERMPVENAVVTFNEDSKLTDDLGLVEFYAPQVMQNTKFIITADKFGYKPTRTTIIVLDVIVLQPNVTYVDDDFNSNTPGWGYDHFNTIQDGIDAVQENGTVNVINGLYKETILIEKSLQLIGENNHGIIIDGFNASDSSVITISSAQYVVIEKIGVTNGRNDGILIINSNDVEIYDSKIRDNRANGIHIITSRLIDISESSILRNLGEGIISQDGYSAGINIENNVIGCSDIGILLSGTRFVDIIGNLILNCEIGVYLNNVYNVDIILNHFRNCNYAYRLNGNCQQCDIWGNTED
jgi:hypothetical protein